MRNKKKLLCVCMNGNNRSTALVYQLQRVRNRHEAIAIGWRRVLPETMEMLCQWADNIIVVESGYVEKIPTEFHYKTVVCDIGPDVWGPKWAGELKSIVTKNIERWLSEGFV